MTPENFAYLACGLVSGALLILSLVVSPLRKRFEPLEQELDEMKDEKHITLGQLSQWKSRAFSQAERAQQWFVAFRSMVETALKVSVNGEGFDAARLTYSDPRYQGG